MNASGPTRLTQDLLEELAGRWRAVGLPVLDRLRPGLSPEQMEEVVGPLGLQLPPEAQVWWGWHDGASQPEASAKERFISPGLEFISLGEAAEVYAGGREVFEEFAEGPDYYWPPTQFSLHSRDSGEITFDCSEVDVPCSPLYYADHYDRVPERDFRVPVAKSFGEMVTWWLEAWDQGIYAYDRGTDHFTADLARFDRARERSGLV